MAQRLRLIAVALLALLAAGAALAAAGVDATSIVAGTPQPAAPAQTGQTASALQRSAPVESAGRTEAGVRLLSSGDRGVIVEVCLPWDQVSTQRVVVDGHEYAQVVVPGWPSTAQTGAPKLPFAQVMLGVPFGAEVVVHVEPGRQKRLALPADPPPGEGVPIAEERPPWGMAAGAGDPPLLPEPYPEPGALGEGPAVYGANGLYPASLAAVLNDGVVRQQRVVAVAAYPVRYDPATREVSVYDRLVVEVAFEARAEGDSVTAEAAEESSAFEQALRETLLNYDQARQWRRKAAARSLPEGLPWTPPVPGYRVKVEQDGIYRLTYAQLAAAGLPVDELDPRTFRLINLGVEVAIAVSGEADGHFDAQDYLLFYGQRAQSKYSRHNVYWLTYGQGAGRRMGVRDGTPGSGQVPAYYCAETHLEQNLIYISVLPGDADLERFLWDYVYPPSRPSWAYTFALPSLYGGPTTARLKIAMFGYLQNPINPDHHTQVYVNGTMVEDAWWDGIAWRLADVEFPQSLLVAGNNTISVVCPNDTGVGYDVVEIDWAELSYANQLLASQNLLAFGYEAAGTWKYEVGGFSSSDLLVFDVTDPQAVQRIVGGVVLPSGWTYTLWFEDQIVAPTDYWTMGTDQFLSVVSIEPDTPSDLHSPSNRADYVIVTHQAFDAPATVLRDYRASQGMAALKVDVQDVYDEFGYGLEGAGAIRNFLAFAWEQWRAPAPSYVLLVGDGHYDPKNYLGYGRVSYLPPYLAPVDPWIVETAGDNRYVTVVGADNFPDMMLGRLAVNSYAEAAAIVNKILNYEQSPPPGEWNKQVLMVADNADQAGNFAQMSDNLVGCCLPEPYQAQKVYYLVTHMTPQEAKAAIIDGINAGKLLVGYVGHSGVNAWAAEGLFGASDVATLQNGGRLPVMLPMTCLDGYYIYPYLQAAGYDATSEVIVRADGRGAVASWSPTGFGIASGHDSLGRGFFTSVFGGRTRILGGATIAGKLTLWATGLHLDLLDTYLLLGDPALRLDVARAELALDKSVSPTTPLQPNDPITYTLSVVNTGPDTAYRVVITDLVPAFVANPQVVLSTLALSPRAGPNFVWDVENLEPGRSGTVVLRGTVDGQAGLGWFSNEARISTSLWDPGALPNEDSVWSLIVAGPPASVQASATPVQIPVGGRISSIGALVSDSWGNPVADGTPVAFSTDLGSTSPATSSTVNGWAYSTLTSGQMAGVATVVAVAGAAQGAVQVVFVAGPPGVIQLTATPDEISTDGASLIQAVVRDSYGNLVADGTLVSFDATLGNVTPRTATTTGGVAVTTLQATGQPGLATVTARAGSASSWVVVKIGEGVPVAISLSAHPDRIPADGVSASAITALVLDAFGQPITETIPITFATTLGQVDPSVTWVVGGVATTSLNGTEAGVAIVTAQAAHASAVVTVGLDAGPPALMALTVDPPQMPVGGQATLFALVADAFGNAVADGTQVEFSATLGSPKPRTVGTVAGAAQTGFDAGWVAGAGTVTAVSGGAVAGASVTVLPGAAGAISLTADPSVLQANGQDQARITAVVVDAHGNPVIDGTPVLFEATLGSVAPLSGQTQAGTATATFQAGTQEGMATVSAWAGAAVGQVQISLVRGASRFILLTAEPTVIQADGASWSMIRALVQDGLGQPMADGTLVAFTTTLGTMTPSVAATAGGWATARLTAGKEVGAALVKAVCGDAEATGVVYLVAGPPAAMGLGAGDYVLPVANRYWTLLTARVVDAWGRSVSDGTPVTFTVSLGWVWPVQVPTVDGWASTEYRAVPAGGYAQITAQTLGGVSHSIWIWLEKARAYLPLIARRRATP